MRDATEYQPFNYRELRGVGNYMKRIMHALLCCIVCAASTTCKSAATVERKAAADAPEIISLMEKIKQLNSRAPAHFSGQFIAEGHLQNKSKFKSLGKVVFRREPFALKITFIDSVFRSTIAEFLHAGEQIKIYMPVEKKVFIDTPDTIRLKNYTGIDLEYGFLCALATGMVPLIENYSIKQGLARQHEKSEKKELFAILDNGALFETISFIDDIPRKIMLIRQSDKEKMEFYLDSPQYSGGGAFYRKVRFLSAKTGDRVSLSFRGIDFTKTPPPGSFDMKIPKNIRTIHVQQ